MPESDNANRHPNISYDSSDQRLYITVPQAWQNRSYQGYVDPSLWDNGINAATLSYSLNAYHSEYDNGNNDTFYGAFNSGVNLRVGAFVPPVTITGPKMVVVTSIFRTATFSVILPHCDLSSLWVRPIRRAKPLTRLIFAVLASIVTAECCHPRRLAMRLLFEELLTATPGSLLPRGVQNL